MIKTGPLALTLRLALPGCHSYDWCAALQLSLACSISTPNHRTLLESIVLKPPNWNPLGSVSLHGSHMAASSESVSATLLRPK